MDSSRFLYHDGHATNCRAALMKAQGARRSRGWSAAGLDAASRIRQINCGEMSRWRRGRGERHMILKTFVEKSGGGHLCLGQILLN